MELKTQTGTSDVPVKTAEEFLPVNPTNRVGDVVWAKLKRTPRPPWEWQDEKSGILRAFAYVAMTDGLGIRHDRIVWKFPGEEVWRVWPGSSRE